MTTDAQGPEWNLTIREGDTIGPFQCTYPSSIADATLVAGIIDPATGTETPATITVVNAAAGTYLVQWTSAPAPKRYVWYHTVTIAGIRRTFWRGTVTVISDRKP
jgi:hypothetical protein